MDKLRAFFQTTEGWTTLASAILGVFVSAGILTPEMSKTIVDIIAILLTVALARIVPKAVTPGETPFVPNGGAK